MKNILRPGCLSLFVVLGLLLMPALTGCKENDKQDKLASSVQTDTGIPVDANLKKRLDEFVHKPRVSGRFGLCVYDLTADKMVYAFNENEPIPSASCMKLLSGVAGYHLLNQILLRHVALHQGENQTRHLAWGNNLQRKSGSSIFAGRHENPG